MNKMFSTALLTWGLAGCVQPPVEQKAKPEVVVQTPDGPVTYNSVDVTLVVTHPREQDTDFVTVEVLNPKGKTFHREVLPLDAQGRAEFRMPVRGTFIEDRAMAGQWSVLATYNHASTPFSAVPLDIQAP